jgi:L-lactate dehydrogenase
MKIGLVGCGMVGAATAYTLVLEGVGRDLVLVDIDEDRARAEAADISHAVPFTPNMSVTAGDYSDLNGARLVIVTAGAAQKPGQTRLDVLDQNVPIFKDIIPKILTNAPEAVLVITTNPVDVLTQVSAVLARDHGVPSSRIIGSGTILDTARFRSLLGLRLGVAPQNVHAYVLGEHGDSEVLTWSSTTIGGMDLDDFCSQNQIAWCEDHRQDIDDNVRNAAYEIIKGKGSTYYGIGSSLTHLAKTIIYDRRHIVTVSTPTPDVAGVKDVSVSLPRLVGRQGVLTTFPAPVTHAERSALADSARVIQNAFNQTNL